MVAKAFILIETEVGRTKEVAANLGHLKEVKSVDPVTGPYDIIAVIEGEGIIEIGDLVTGSIQRVSDIYRTVACLT
jgi:DNA-binding Lrp family transcriptional regulator